MEINTVQFYCSDCGTGVPSGSLEGCCVNRDWRTGEPMRAGVIGALDWNELVEEEQALVVTLLTFPERAAPEPELLVRLHWTTQLLTEVVAPAGQHAADMACAIRIGETIRLTDQARDAFFSRLQEVGEQLEDEHQPAA